LADLLMLRIPVSGEWYAYEWSEFISAVDALYFDMSIIEIISQLSANITSPPKADVSTRIERLVRLLDDPPNRWELVQGDGYSLETSMGSDIVLRVASIQYGSDGKLDLVGIGQAMEATADVLKALIEYAGNAPDRKLKKVAVIEKQIAVFKAAGFSDEEVKAYTWSLLAKHDKRLFRKLKEIDRIKVLPAPSNWQNRPLLPAPPAPPAPTP